MFPSHSVTTIWISLTTLLNLCLSQNTTTTSPSKEEEDDFYSASTVEILILVGVIVICPLIILAIRWWQKAKTNKFAKSRQERLDHITAGAMQRNEIQLAKQAQRVGMSTNGVPMHQQSPSQQPIIHHGEMQERHIQTPALPLTTSNAAPVQVQPNIIPAPSRVSMVNKPAAMSVPRAVSLANNIGRGSMINNKPKPNSKPKEFERRRTEIVYKSANAKARANAKPNAKSNATQHQKSHSLLHRKANGQFSSQGVPAPPSGPPPNSPKNKDVGARKRDVDIALDMLIESPSNQPQSQPQTKPRPLQPRQPPPAWNKVQSVSGVVKKEVESAIILPDVENDVASSPPQSIPRTKTFNALTGAPIMELNEEEDKDAFKRNRDRIKTEDIERSISIPDNEKQQKEKEREEEKKADDGDISDSSSGESLDQNDRKLLQIAHQQMKSHPPPSLQTIFGRRVVSKDDKAESESEDSLLKRQAQYEKAGDGSDELGSPPDKDESKIILNV